MKRFLLVMVTAALVISPGAVQTNAQSNALGFFKNYFITGDYEVAGVGLRGRRDGDIDIEHVPPDVDIAAAYLYWQVVATGAADPDAGSLGASFRGFPLSTTDGPLGKLIGIGAPGCGSGEVSADHLASRVFSYRADVLRFLDVDETTGKLAANGRHEVQVPNNDFVQAVGASLVVVYRDPSKPFSAIVLNDGAYSMSAATGATFQQIQGFYDAATAARLTHIVGGATAGTAATLRYNGAAIAANPFRSVLGPRWDNPTFSLTADPNLRAVTTSVDPFAPGAADCLTWSAIVYRTTVKDFDGDGLLDLWESSDAPLVDPNGQTLPNLKAMGAAPDRKDVFVELGYMKTDAPTAYGAVTKPAHTHQPGHEALKLIGDAFAAAPTGQIAVHFDVGATYPSGPADPYIIRSGARGGEVIDESVTVCTPGPTDAPYVCQFSAHPGTVGWKSGYRFLRDEPQVLHDPPPPPGVDCDEPGVHCERRFDRTRLNMFHYALFAHAVGLPESDLPCLDASGIPVPDVNDQCAVAPNPAFHTPRTTTGVGDFPGGDALVTLGGFNDLNGRPVGTPFMQASTLMHEFGHNAERRHGGEAFEQNCKPTYLSAMNYLYQLRGLLDDTGTPRLDFSRSLEATVDEAALPTIGFLPYRIGWYAPLATSYLAGRGTAARNHCNGSPLLPTDAAMVRIDARTAAGVIDWDADNVAGGATTLDVNFNGRIDGPGAAALPGSEDWSALRLDQFAARRNVGGLYLVPGTTQFAVGPLSLDSGKGDLGKGDLGKGDLGKGDLGKGDLGKGDLGKGDLGKGDLGKGDLGKGDLGGGDLFDGDPNNPGGELDANIVNGLARTPPNQFSACVVGETCQGSAARRHQVELNWSAPNVGDVASYIVYRVAGDTLLPGQTWTTVTTFPATPGRIGYEFFDTTPLVHGAPYTYFAVASYTDGASSDPSNLVTITAFNASPAIAFVGVKNIPPDNTTVKAGSTVPLSWRYQNGAAVVDSAAAAFEVRAVGPKGTFVNTDPGKSGFRYNDGVWRFNLQTKGPDGKAYPKGVYQVTVTSLTAGFPSGPPFTLTVTK